MTATPAAVSEDPFVQLVDHLAQVFHARHNPGVVAQVTLRCWTVHHERCRGFDDPALETLVRARLTLMPPSIDHPPAVSSPRSSRTRLTGEAEFMRAYGDHDDHGDH